MAIAGYDSVGNVGVLSEVVCGTPEPVIDFFDVYREWGGLAGGGFCNCSVVGVQSDKWLGAMAALFALGLALGWRRDKRPGGVA